MIARFYTEFVLLVAARSPGTPMLSQKSARLPASGTDGILFTISHALRSTRQVSGHDFSKREMTLSLPKGNRGLAESCRKDG